MNASSETAVSRLFKTHFDLFYPRPILNRGAPFLIERRTSKENNISVAQTTQESFTFILSPLFDLYIYYLYIFSPPFSRRRPTQFRVLANLGALLTRALATVSGQPCGVIARACYEVALALRNWKSWLPAASGYSASPTYNRQEHSLNHI